MTKQQKLTALIEQALKNGWVQDSLEGIDKDRLSFKVVNLRVYWNLKLPEREVPLLEASIYGTIFDHSFAKAIWGEEKTIIPGVGTKITHHWMPHLQQAVISADPLQYYWENK